jgi:hypothetical protein
MHATYAVKFILLAMMDVIIFDEEYFTSSPFRLTSRDFFFQLNLYGHIPYATSSLTRRWVCLLWICLALSNVRIAHIACYWKFLLFTIYKSSVSTGFAKQIVPILRILCYNGSLVTWTIVSLTTAKFKPLTFSMSGFTFSYTANMFILTILYDFCLLPAQFCYIIVYIRKVESCVQIAPGMHLGKFPTVRRTLFCRRCNFKR